jgi:hypothetical protein
VSSDRSMLCLNRVLVDEIEKLLEEYSPYVTLGLSTDPDHGNELRRQEKHRLGYLSRSQNLSLETSKDSAHVNDQLARTLMHNLDQNMQECDENFVKKFKALMGSYKTFTGATEIEWAAVDTST